MPRRELRKTRIDATMFPLLLQQLDQYAERNGLTRSEALSRAVELLLNDTARHTGEPRVIRMTRIPFHDTALPFLYSKIKVVDFKNFQDTEGFKIRFVHSSWADSLPSLDAKIVDVAVANIAAAKRHPLPNNSSIGDNYIICPPLFEFTGRHLFVRRKVIQDILGPQTASSLTFTERDIARVLKSGIKIAVENNSDLAEWLEQVFTRYCPKRGPETWHVSSAEGLAQFKLEKIDAIVGGLVQNASLLQDPSAVALVGPNDPVDFTEHYNTFFLRKNSESVEMIPFLMRFWNRIEPWFKAIQIKGVDGGDFEAYYAGLQNTGILEEDVSKEAIFHLISKFESVKMPAMYEWPSVMSLAYPTAAK